MAVQAAPELAQAAAAVQAAAGAAAAAAARAAHDYPAVLKDEAADTQVIFSAQSPCESPDGLKENSQEMPVPMMAQLPSQCRQTRNLSGVILPLIELGLVSKCLETKPSAHDWLFLIQTFQNSYFILYQYMF